MACMVVLAMFCVSFRVMMQGHPLPHVAILVELGAAEVHVDGHDVSAWTWAWDVDPLPEGWETGRRWGRLLLQPSYSHFPQFLWLRVPLLIPFVAIAIPTTVLWYRDRRRAKLGYCAKCGYDLTGNESGRCPECGKAV